MSAAPDEQLSALAQVSKAFDGANVDYWLFGGWAVDFHVGSVTRPHDDVDLAVWLADLPRVTTILAGQGWRHVPDPDEDGGTGYERSGVRVELTYLDRDAAADVVTPLAGGPARWPSETFGPDVLELDGVRSRVVALASLASMKSYPRDDPGDARKDRDDVNSLSSLPGSRGRATG